MLRLRAPAKLNLDLRVAAPRPDGFHPLSSWFVTLGLWDELTFERHPAPGIHFSCSDPLLAVDGRNLVVRAAGELLDATGHTTTGVAISLTKHIPAGGGLGGGSSDAATTLVGLSKLLGLSVDPGDLMPLAERLGSDVPFFLDMATRWQATGSALCTGRGEVVDPLPMPAPRAALLLFPEVRMPTPAVFREFDRLSLGRDLLQRGEASRAYQHLTGRDASDLLPRLFNALEPAAFSLAPDLGDLRAQAEDRLHRPVRMSGSGSTLFTLFDTTDEADSAVGRARGGFPPGLRWCVSPLCPGE